MEGANLFQNGETRDIPFSMRFTPSEAQLLRQMAQEEGLSWSGIVRSLIRRALNSKCSAGNAWNASIN